MFFDYMKTRTFLMITALVLAGCGGGNNLFYDTSVELDVTGLADDAQISVQLNDAEIIAVKGPGTHSFASRVPVGDAYFVSLSGQPNNHQACSVQNNAGIMTDSTATVKVTCTSGVEADIQGLEGGRLALQLNGDEIMNVSSAGLNMFSQPLSVGGAYQVTVSDQPKGFQWCSTVNASGTVASSKNTVTVNCGSSVGLVSTIAGQPRNAGYENGPSASAKFNYPVALTYDKIGNLYIADRDNHVIRKIDAHGNVSTFAGTPNVAGSSNGPLGVGKFSRLMENGLTFDKNGNLFVSDNMAIRKVDPNGVITTVAGTPGVVGYVEGSVQTAKFSWVSGLAFDSIGNLYAADTGNAVIRKIDTNGLVTTFAGFYSDEITTIDGPLGIGSFGWVSALVFDENDILYASDRGVGIRKISKDGYITSITSNQDLKFRNTNVLVRDSLGNFYMGGIVHDHYLLKVTPSGVVSELAGSHAPEGIIDGKGDAARFGNFMGMTIDPSGNLLVSDATHHVIRKIVPAAP